jgi:hypothetical protein
MMEVDTSSAMIPSADLFYSTPLCFSARERDEAEFGLVSYFEKGTVLRRIDVDGYKTLYDSFVKPILSSAADWAKAQASYAEVTMLLIAITIIGARQRKSYKTAFNILQ